MAGVHPISYFQAIVLGVIQGIAEPFPISSLGHSVVLPKLFGWNITPMGPAAMIDTGQIPGVPSIAGHISSLGHEPHNYVTVYVQVDDINAYIAKAVELGGKKLVDPVKIPMGTFAWIADIDGSVIGLWQT